MNQAAEPEEQPLRFLTITETTQLVRLGKSTLYTRIGAGDFPMPVRIGNKSMFVAHEVDAWMREQVAKRPAAMRQQPKA